LNTSARATRDLRSRPALAAFRQADLSLCSILGLFCLGFAGLLSGRQLPWTTFQQEVVAAFGLLLLAAAALERTSSVVWPRLAVLLCVVASLPLIQRATGQIRYLDDAILPAGYIAMLAISICVGATLATGLRRKQLLDGIAACVVLTGITSAGIALCQWLGPSVWSAWIEVLPARGRPVGNIGQPNHLSTLLLLGLAGLLYWYEQRRIDGWCAALGAAWLGWGVVISQSRTGWLAVALLGTWWLLMRRRAGLRLPPRAVLIGTFLFTLAVLAEASLFALWSVPLDLEGAAHALRLTSARRGVVWETLWHASMQAPWLGYGWNQIANAHFASAAAVPGISTWLSHSHNLVLDLILYNGIPLGLLLTGLLVAWFVRRVRECRDSASWCWLLAIFFVFLHALLEYPLHYAYFLIPTGLLMGIVGSRSTHSFKTGRLALAAPVTVVAIVMAVAAIEYVDAEEALRDLRLASLQVGQAPKDLPKPHWKILESWKAYHNAMTSEITGNMSSNDIAALRALAARYPYPNVLSQYAHAAALNKQPAAAQAALDHACKVHKASVCESMQGWWSRLGASDSLVRQVDFPVQTH
jgi:O-antigen ligase